MEVVDGKDGKDGYKPSHQEIQELGGYRSSTKLWRITMIA